MRTAKLNIADFTGPATGADLAMPVVLVAGTSMSAGKTLTMRLVIDQLKQLGLSVAAAKLTGAAGYKDALSYGDAGADHFFDYVDVGLVSTVCARADFDAGLEALLAIIAGTGADVAVCEIGASPLEPYNGDAALERLKPNVRLAALCASDAYAAHGFCQSCDCAVDFVTGPAANNSAARALVKKLTALPAFDLSDKRHVAKLRALLGEKVTAGEGAAAGQARKA